MIPCTWYIHSEAAVHNRILKVDVETWTWYDPWEGSVIFADKALKQDSLDTKPKEQLISNLAVVIVTENACVSSHIPFCVIQL